MIAVANERAVESSAAFAAWFQAFVLRIGAVMLVMLVLAAAPQNPRSFGYYVEESRAFAAAFGALVPRAGVLLEPVAANAAALLADSQALLVAFLAAPHKHCL